MGATHMQNLPCIWLACRSLLRLHRTTPSWSHGLSHPRAVTWPLCQTTGRQDAGRGSTAAGNHMLGAGMPSGGVLCPTTTRPKTFALQYRRNVLGHRRRCLYCIVVQWG